MSNATELTATNFDETVSEGVTLIDFWAEWCGPCKMISPIIDEIAGEYEGKAKVAKINIDNEADLAAKFAVSSIPTLLIIKDGQEDKRFIGVTPKADLAAALDSAVG
jgi:thioredoxin 1